MNALGVHVLSLLSSPVHPLVFPHMILLPSPPFQKREVGWDNFIYSIPWAPLTRSLFYHYFFSFPSLFSFLIDAFNRVRSGTTAVT